MNDVNEGLEYAQMLEIPVSTVNVVKKRGFFSRKRPEAEDLKDSVIQNANSRLEAENEFFNENGFVKTEDISSPVKEKKRLGAAGVVIACEAAAACILAAGIFLTNIFVPNTAINTFVANLTAVSKSEAAYSDFTLSSPVSALSNATLAVSEEGVISFTGKTNVYPVCDGEVAEILSDGDLYTVKIAHTSAFCSVISGVSTVYSFVGEEVKANLPVAYSNGEKEVNISLYNGGELLNCYTVSGVVPVWNT